MFSCLCPTLSLQNPTLTAEVVPSTRAPQIVPFHTPSPDVRLSLFPPQPTRVHTCKHFVLACGTGYN